MIELTHSWNGTDFTISHCLCSPFPLRVSDIHDVYAFLWAYVVHLTTSSPSALWPNRGRAGASSPVCVQVGSARSRAHPSFPHLRVFGHPGPEVLKMGHGCPSPGLCFLSAAFGSVSRLKGEAWGKEKSLDLESSTPPQNIYGWLPFLTEMFRGGFPDYASSGNPPTLLTAW